MHLVILVGYWIGKRNNYNLIFDFVIAMDSVEKKYLSFLTSDGGKEFKCNICNRYLSVGPILFNETVGKVCGRCYGKGETKKFANIAFESQIVYEDIAKHIIFPCSFREKGCEELLKWNSTHEDSCPYKENECPFGLNASAGNENNCKWEGGNKDLFDHLTTEHKDSFYELSNLKITFPCNLKNSLILSWFEDILIVVLLSLSSDSKSILHKIWMNIPFIKCKSFTYDLEVSNENGKYHMTFPENEITSLYNSVFTKNCEYEFDLNIYGLRTLLKSKDQLNFWFKIKPPQINECMNSGSELSLNNHLIFDWKCSNCGKLLQSPIYLCNNNHNCCNNCYQEKTNCYCGVRVSKYKNDMLENLSKVAYYTCKNREQGCSALLTSEQLGFHENNCKLTEKLCMIGQGCSWTGNNVNMLRHVIDSHFPINLDETILFDLQNKKKRCCLIFDEHIFVLTINHKLNDSLSISCQCLGVSTAKYLFEFGIFSDCLKLQCKHFCEPFFYGDDMNILVQPQAIVYPFDFLKQFLSEQNKFSFKLKIFNIPNK